MSQNRSREASEARPRPSGPVSVDQSVSEYLAGDAFSGTAAIKSETETPATTSKRSASRTPPIKTPPTGMRARTAGDEREAVGVETQTRTHGEQLPVGKPVRVTIKARLINDQSAETEG